MISTFSCHVELCRKYMILYLPLQKEDTVAPSDVVIDYNSMVRRN